MKIKYDRQNKKIMQKENLNSITCRYCVSEMF